MLFHLVPLLSGIVLCFSCYLSIFAFILLVFRLLFDFSILFYLTITIFLSNVCSQSSRMICFFLSCYFYVFWNPRRLSYSSRVYISAWSLLRALMSTVIVCSEWRQPKTRQRRELLVEVDLIVKQTQFAFTEHYQDRQQGSWTAILKNMMNLTVSIINTKGFQTRI